MTTVTSRPVHPRPAALPASDTEATDLRLLVQTFIRSAGLLAGGQTPCGHPVAVSHAHALMVLLETAREARRVPQLALGHASGFPRRFEQDHERVGMGDRYGMAAGCLTAREKPGGPYEGLDQESQVRRFGVRGWQGSRPRVNGS